MKSDRPLGIYFGSKPDIRTFQEDNSLPLSNKFIGIEIEAENVPFSLEDMSRKLFYWDVTHDGSLRNFGAEFITKKLKGKDIITAFSELEAFLASNKIAPEYSNRTSCHVHIDCRYLLFSQLKNLVLLYLIYEPIFFKYIGHDRDKNNYCVPYFRNFRGLKNLSWLFHPAAEPDAIIYSIVEDANKYEAMNVKSLEKHGTIEFRHHYGTHDQYRLLPWIQALLFLAREAKTSSEGDILNNLNTLSYEKFVEGVNSYLKVQDLSGCERLAKTSIGSLLTMSIPSSR